MTEIQDSAIQRMGTVIAVCCSPTHSFSKPIRNAIRLVKGLGVEGDAHFGRTVQHLSRLKKFPAAPNLRQVHFIHSELLGELRLAGFEVGYGDLGENVTTQQIDLLALPRGTLLYLGNDAVVEVTGLRNPCVQLDRFTPGLMAAVLGKDESGNVIRKAGVMGVIRTGGIVRAGDWIRVEHPPPPHQPLECV